RPLYGFSRKRQ
ncbi:liporeleasing system, transmembrane LolE domain protein, partial [Vibrio parahaemolyticus AQ3810]